MHSENISKDSIGFGPCNQGGSETLIISDAPPLAYSLERQKGLNERSGLHCSDSQGPLSLGHTVADSYINTLTTVRSVSVWNGVSEVSAVPQWKEATSGTRREKRGKITERSQKSRVRQLKHLAKLPSLPEMFSCLTFTDDVMEGKSQAERLAFSNRCLRELNHWMWEKCGAAPWQLTWSREYKRRKSGELVMELIPHFHMLWAVPGFSESDYRKLTIRINQAWVRIIGTRSPEKAMRVLMRDKSHEYLGGSAKKAIGYCVSYSTKQKSDAGEPGVSIGRTWGTWGPIEETEPEVIGLTEPELMSIKRGLRRKFRKARGWFLLSLKIRQAGTMAFMTGSEMIRWVETMRVQNKGAGLPF